MLNKTISSKTQQLNGKFSLFNMGFRPFYLLGSVYAVFIIPLWISLFLGYIDPHAHLTGLEWHMHETIFGFFPAIMVGFLFTAIPHWTNLPTPRGKLLVFLSMYYVIARILINSPYYSIGVIFDISFLFIAVMFIAFPIIKRRNYRNFPIVLIVFYFAVLNAIFHLNVIFQQGKICTIIAQISLDLIMLLIVGIGGRVIPQFTQNAFPSIKVMKWTSIEYASLLSIFALVILDSFLIGHNLAIYQAITIIAFIANLIRYVGWKPLSTLGNPIVWILHASYGWLIISLALRSLVAMGVDLPYSIGIHAFTVGGMGGMTIALMTRSARGHTGRELKASWLEIMAYISIQFAALLRTICPLIKGEYFLQFIQLSSLLWCLAFGLFFLGFLMPLVLPRIDGKLG